MCGLYNMFIIGETGNIKLGNFSLRTPPSEDSILDTFGEPRLLSTLSDAVPT